MNIHDLQIHPAFLDPRRWADVKLYESTFNVDREPIKGVEHHTPDRKFAIRHLKLDLKFDDEEQKVSGAAVMTFVPLSDDFRFLELDIAEMSISGIKILRVERDGPGEPIEWVADRNFQLEFETRLEKLLIEFDRSYTRKERLVVEIRYSCTPRKGLYFIKPDEAYPGKRRQIWSQGENEDAHWWFPCHDVTNQKMTTELLATVRSNYFALSNGELIGVHENHGEGTRTYHWSQPQPHPAYLVSVVIGEYEHLSDNCHGLPVDYYVYRDQQAAGQRLFANTPQMIKFFEERFGSTYPYPKYAQILVEDFLFGAMENTSATTMTDRCLLDDQAALDLNYDEIVSHELAHQWWGDLVTCKDWAHIWLNESFATYAEYLWREQTLGRDEARFVLFQDFMAYLHEDLTSHRRPIVYNRYRFSEEVMDRHAYEKGACVLDMLRSELGDDAFFLTLSHYLNKFRFGVAETNDFKVAIEEVTGRNLHWFFDQWLYSAGYPELEVGYEWRREQKVLRVSVKQVQDLKDQTAVFRFPVEIEIVTVESGEIIETERRAGYRVVVEKAEQDFYFPCDSKPRLVVFDKDHRIFKIMRFPKSSQELIYQLTRDDDPMGRMRAARELSVFKSEEVAEVLRLTLLGPDFYGVRMAAAVSLGEIGGENAYAALTEGYRGNEDPRVRRTCVLMMGNFQDESLKEENIEFLRAVLEEDESYFVGVAAVRALANLGGDKAYDILASSLSHTSWQEVVAAAVFHGFEQDSTWVKEKRLVDLAIDQSRYGKPIPIRVAALSCLGALGKELHKSHDDDRIVDYLIELLKDKNIRARVSAVRALGKVGNRRALAALRQAQQRECLDQLKAALLDAVACIEEK